MYFDKFTRRVEIAATLRCLTALRIGAGKSSTDITSSDLPILRGADDRPLIPGSSLKGVLRSAVESMLRAIPEKSEEIKKWACDPFVEELRCVSTKDPSDAEQRVRMQKQRERMKGLCRACRTFGAPSYASHVLFRDARTGDRVRVERRDGVAIDRDLGRVSGARKYDFEVVAEGTTFDFGVSIDSAEKWQEGLVVLALDILHEGFARVGGATSRGLGRVALENRNVRVLDQKRLLSGKGPASISWEEYRTEALGAWERYVQAGGTSAGEV
jgi:CRISPR-associated protein Csm3